MMMNVPEFQNVTGFGAALFPDPNLTLYLEIQTTQPGVRRLARPAKRPGEWVKINSLYLSLWLLGVKWSMKKTQDSRTCFCKKMKINKMAISLWSSGLDSNWNLCPSVRWSVTQQFWRQEKQAESTNLRMQHPTRFLRGPSGARMHQHIQHIRH